MTVGGDPPRFVQVFSEPPRQAHDILAPSEHGPAFTGHAPGCRRARGVEMFATFFGIDPAALLRKPEGWAPWGSNPEPAVNTFAQVIVGPWRPRVLLGAEDVAS